MFFMADKLFCYNFMNFFCFDFISKAFCSPMTQSPQSKIQLVFLTGKSGPRHDFQLLSNVSYDCEYICLKKISVKL